MAIPHSPHFKSSDDRPKPGETPEVPAGTDRDIIFSLIDRVLPFEACLYHQVLPLSLRDNQLRLGMVDLMDVSALDYLRKVLAYFQYRLAPQVIPSDLHHQILSAYLKFKVNPNVNPVEPLEPSTVFGEQTDPMTGQEDAVTTGANAGNTHKGFEGQPPVFFEQPGIVLKDEQPTISREHPIVDKQGLPALPIDRHTRDTLIIEAPQTEFDRSTFIQPHPSRSISPQSQVPKPAPLALPGNALPQLEVSRLPINASSEQLLALSPKDLLQALLGRVLADGIGRLFFEHQGNQGRILWSDSGVFQSFLDCLPLDTFNGVIAELKRLTSLPMDPVEEVVQVEIERIHEKNRLLLRLKLMPKPQIGDQPRSEGEDATLQILRGTALRFYQQHQVSSLSRDTLTVARQLQRKVEELHRRSHLAASINSDEFAVMPEIQEVLKTVKNQLIDIERQTSTFTSPMP
ncbi:MAG: hypothetical protein NT070_04020 [Cyanobacteria bacterium]|nr:hypothetical protein [Cyanobacteriota bacterium]